MPPAKGVIVTEMTDNHHMMVPLMAAAVIATAVSRLIAPIGVYHALARNFCRRHRIHRRRGRKEMMGRIDRRMAELGIELPRPSTPGANYVPFTRSGNQLFLTGQLSQWNGERRFIGKLGREFGIEEGRQAARLSALNLIAHLRAALDGNLDRVSRCLRLAGYVNSLPSFTDQSKVMDGASDLFVEIFGEAGRHARLAIGVAVLPYDVAVEVEGVFEIGQG